MSEKADSLANVFQSYHEKLKVASLFSADCYFLFLAPEIIHGNINSFFFTFAKMCYLDSQKTLPVDLTGYNYLTLPGEAFADQGNQDKLLDI